MNNLKNNKNNKINNNNKKVQQTSSPGGLEPPSFRLTAERANRLRHGDTTIANAKQIHTFRD